MPLYEFVCESCGNAFEVLVRTTNGESPECPACKSPEVSRKLSVFGVASSGQATSQPPCHGCGQAGSCPMSH